jgi:spore germination cell wall hydrolase CwlJ-like protein
MFESRQVKGGLMEKSLKAIMCVVGFIFVAQGLAALTQAKFDKLKESNAMYSTDVITIKTRERQLDCLAMNIYREAGYEPFEGKVAVAQVTMNRVKDGRFGDDVCGVIFKKNVVMDKVVCQFSWYCDSAAKTRPINQSAYNESMAVAKKVLLEGFKLDILKEALYYHANYVNPRWPLEKIGSIGNHIFYKGKDTGDKYAKL